MREFINTEEAAQQLGYTARHVRLLISRGVIKAQKMGTGSRSVYIIPLNKEFQKFKAQRDKKRAKLPSGSPAR